MTRFWASSSAALLIAQAMYVGLPLIKAGLIIAMGIAT